MAARKKNETKTTQPISYTQASEELDEILREIEDGSVDVDVLTERVERAAVLIRTCRDKLTGARTRVTKVVEELAALAETKAEAETDGDADGASARNDEPAEAAPRTAEADDDLPF